MRTRRVLITGLGLLGAFTLWWVEMPGDASTPPTPVGEHVPDARTGPVSSAPTISPALADGASPPSTDDPEALASWFREEVLRGLERPPAAGPSPEPAPPVLPSGPRRNDPSVNWAYVRDVLAGRVSGIPDERQAGLSLQEMDQIGDIPYVEKLRSEQRYDELRALGFENENAPWPACLRSATCRRDRASSPPS